MWNETEVNGEFYQSLLTVLLTPGCYSYLYTTTYLYTVQYWSFISTHLVNRQQTLFLILSVTRYAMNNVAGDLRLVQLTNFWVYRRYSTLCYDK